MKVKKKPVVIEAINIGNMITMSKAAWSTLPEWVQKHYEQGSLIFTPEGAEVKTLEGWLKGRLVDFLMCGVKGEIYPCRDDIFYETYDKVEE